MTTWKPIPDHPFYEVSDEGVVRSLRFDPPRPISQRLANTGYLRVTLYQNRGREDRSVHRLVAELFLPEPEPGQEVRHLNNDKTDNRVVNLAWGTRKQNVEDMMRAGNHYLQNPLKYYRCDECELTSTAPGVARHHKTSGHRGRTLEEENSDVSV